MKNSLIKKQVPIGAAISYLLIIINALYGFFVSPFILDCLGASSFGVYKTVASLSSAMMVLDFGLGGTVMRYISRYKADKKENKINPFVTMATCESAVIVFIIGIVMTFVYFSIDDIYKESFSTSEIYLAKKLFAVLAVSMVFHIGENILNGIITGYNNFILANGIKLVRIILRIILIFLMLSVIKNALVLVFIDLTLTVLIVIVELLYIANKYKIKLVGPKKSWDAGVFKESFLYTFLLFVTSIVAQINNNLDNVIIGAIKGSSFVTVYSFGLLIFGMFEQLSTSISGVMLPTVTNALNSDDPKTNVQKIIIGAGRIQFMLLGGVCVAFGIIGKQFISLWLGKGFDDVYMIVMILMIPAVFELCVNVCLSILRAENKLGFRTAVLFLSTILNMIITVLGVKKYGYIAAAVGTAMSFIIGSLIVMNVYYYKKLGFDMIKIYAQIVSKTWLCLLISGTAVALSSKVFVSGWIAFIINAVVFVVVYGITLLLFGLSKQEKENIPVLNKILVKVKQKRLKNG